MPSLLVFTKLWLHYVLQQATNAMRSHSPVEMSACRDDAFMQTPQMIFNSTHIRGLSLFSWRKLGNFWHITRLPTSNCCKVVSSRKQHGFWPTSYVAYNGQYCATPVAFLVAPWPLPFCQITVILLFDYGLQSRDPESRDSVIGKQA